VHTAAIIKVIIALMMEAVCSSETWVYFNETTQHYIPESYHLHSHHLENPNSHHSATLMAQKKHINKKS
jgi:hypothetical protein